MALLTTAERQQLQRIAQAMHPRSGEALGVVAHAHRGSGYELHGHDPYRPGDDIRHLDWQARVRTGELWVRRFHAEGDSALRIVLDASLSMQPKLRDAKRLGGALAVLASTRGRPFALDILGEPSETARADTDYVARLARFEDVTARRQPSLIPLFSHLVRTVKRGDQVVVITDLADEAPVSELLGPLASLASRGRLRVIMVQAAADMRLPVASRVRSPEQPRFRVVASAVRDSFAATVATWRRAIDTAAVDLGLPLDTVDISPGFELVPGIRNLVAAWP